jgi:hypothetical protein
MLLSFERPAPPEASPAHVAVGVQQFRQSLPPAILENCIVATATAPSGAVAINGLSPNHLWFDHRQDSKGTRWMPWHQESMKGVDGCDKPR